MKKTLQRNQAGLPFTRKTGTPLLLIMLLITLTSLSLPASAATITGMIWNDINADTLVGDAAHNTPGSNVLTQADNSQRGALSANTYGDPVVPGAGVESGYEGVQLCVTGTNTCTMTAADGTYSLEVPDGSSITVNAPEGYLFSSDDPAGDNDADQQPVDPVPPNPWTAQITAASIAAGNTNAGIAPIPKIVTGWFDTNGINDGVQGIISGSADYNTHGNCQTTAPYEDPLDASLNMDTAFSDPGDDCHKYDTVVRTNDTVDFVPTIKLDNSPAGGIDNIILEIQFSSISGADLQIDTPLLSGLPVGCETGSSFSPPSGIIEHADGGLTLICNIGTIENGQEFRVISLKPTGSSPNGSGFKAEINAYAAANNAVPGTEQPSPELQISSIPQFDITKNAYNGAAGIDGGSARNVSGLYPGTSSSNHVTGITENGLRIIHQISILADGTGRGISALGDSFTFDEVIDPRYAAFGARVTACTPTITGSWTAPLDGNGAAPPYEDNRTIDNGSWSCATDGSSNTITISNADTSGAHYPETGGSGASTSPHKIVVTGQISVWYPYSAFYRFAGADKIFNTADDGASLNPNDPNLWQYGDDPITGTYQQTNCLANFDPDSLDAQGNTVSNYGTNYEPGWDGSTANANNCRNTSFNISVTGSFHKRYAGAWYLDDTGQLTDRHRFFDAPRYHWACTGTPDRLIVPGQSACGSGDGPIVGNQLFTASLIFHANRSAIDLEKPELCEVIDNSTYTLEKIPANTNPAIPAQIVGKYAYYNYNDSAIPGIDGGPGNLGYVYAADHGFYLEYARFNPANTSQRTWQINHATGAPDPISSIVPLDNAQQQLAAKDCGSALTTSGELEWTADPDAAGWDIGDVVIVRMKSDDGVAIQAGDYSTNMHLHFKAREHFYAPDFPAEDGQIIPLGTLLANVSNYAYDNDGDGNTDYGTGSYDAASHTGANASGSSTLAYGDRLIFQTVNASIEKQAYQFWNGSSAGDDDTTQVNVGDSIMWSLHPSINSINNAAIAKDVTITDTLPAYVEYAPGCTPPPPAGLSGPVVQLNTPNAGETTLTWSYDSDLPANQSLEPISVCTNTDPFAPAEPSLDVINQVEIRASNIAYSRRSHTRDRLVEMVQVGRFAVAKSVDFPLDFQEQDQVWTLQWANTSDTFPFNPPDIIDVFAFMGDGPGSGAERELYPSNYNGGARLTAIPDIPQVTGSTGNRADGGQWYATCEAPGTINFDPQDASNNLPGIWIAVPANSRANPSGSCLLEDVTAIRWISSDTLLAQDNATVSFPLQTYNNEANNLYVNRYSAYTASFDETVRSNEPFVQIIGFTLGDLLWMDANGNNIFDEGSDITAPAGLPVTLYDDNDNQLSTTTTDANGRWYFEALTGDQYDNSGSYVAGNYYVTIDISSLPPGWKAGDNPQTDPNSNENENTDHHLIEDNGILRSAGLVQLSANVNAAGLITGAEPVGDNVKILGNPLIRDDLTNFTLDLMLSPERGNIEVTKQLEWNEGPLDNWQFTIVSNDTTECPLPITNFNNPAASDNQGKVQFDNLLVYGITTGNKCSYTIAETGTQGSWTYTSQTPGGPHEVADGATTAVNVLNNRNKGALKVDKSVLGNAAPQGWRFTLSSLTADCNIPATTDNPQTTVDGSGGSVTFDNLPTHAATTPFAECLYQVDETSQNGWLLNTAPGNMTNLQVSNGNTSSIDVSNKQDVIDLSLQKKTFSADGLTEIVDVRPGNQFIYRLEVVNDGPQDAANVVIEDKLPPQVTYISNDSGATYANGTLTWTLNSLPNGATATLDITVQVPW
uniref:DUF11 domain-containing protein n=1 Tax=uncultured Thiotrichaceae bacterium TaxID=298394 RepID=A0A6S6SD41_9GAMM|nr:MAG: Unknown protein [uncultured Thiotrichaceae bacterium]